MPEGESQHGASPPEMPPPSVRFAPPTTAEFDDEEPGERGTPTGNRWPREETLALLKIRSELDADFREATLKGPLWEEVSRRLANLGYSRSGKKCREKFENVHKYYKRTKDHRAGRSDGKSYRFFAELQALQNTGNYDCTNNETAIAVSSLNTSPAPPTVHHPTPLSAIPPAAAAMQSESYSASDTEDTCPEESRKRKRPEEGSRRRRMMAFFEGMMKEVMERQEAMQCRFLEAIERIERERLAREENWRRQEASRNLRESEASTRERVAAAGRDASIMALLHRLSSRAIVATHKAQVSANISVPTPAPVSELAVAPSPTHAPAPVVAPSPVPASALSVPNEVHPAAVVQSEQPRLMAGGDHSDGRGVLTATMEEHSLEVGSSSSGDPVSSRWPKEEVQALIEIRTNMESRYQEAGPKGPLWEEISTAMRRIGYNRNPKRCKEKWENINKYFKRVKESNKKRPDDSKTCTYFHQLDNIYRSKSAASHGTVVQVAAAAVQSPPKSLEVEEGRGNGPCSPHGQREVATSANKTEDHLMEGSQNGHRVVHSQLETGPDRMLHGEEEKRALQNLEHQSSNIKDGFSRFNISKTTTGAPFLALWSKNGEDGGS